MLRRQTDTQRLLLHFCSSRAWRRSEQRCGTPKLKATAAPSEWTACAQVDKVNRQVAARMAGSSSFTSFRKFDERRQGLMRAQLQRIIAQDGLSENVFEIVSSSLQD